MLIKDMIDNYTALRKELSDKAAGLKKIKEPEQYDYINELDEINEQLYVIYTQKYEIPAASVGAILLEGIENNEMSVPQMIENLKIFDTFLQSSLSFVKDTASKPYATYLTRLEDLQYQINTAIDYIEKRDLFENTDITSEGYIKLDAPYDITCADGILKWHKVERAVTYNVFYKSPSDTEYLHTITAPFETEYNFVTTDVSSLPSGTYDIKIQANSDKTVYQSSFAETTITI